MDQPAVVPDVYVTGDLASIDFSVIFNTDIDYDALAEELAHHRHVRHITVYSASLVTEYDWLGLFQDLRSLHLNHAMLNNFHLPPLMSLEMLTLRDVTIVDIRQVTTFRQCPNLRALHIAGWTIGATDMQWLEPLTVLEELVLSSIDHRLVSLDGIQHCHQLHRFELGRTSGITDLTPLTGCDNLEILILADLPNLRDFNPLAQCYNLRELKLVQLKDVSLPVMRQLEVLELYRSSVDTNGVSPITNIDDYRRAWPVRPKSARSVVRHY